MNRRYYVRYVVGLLPEHWETIDAVRDCVEPLCERRPTPYAVPEPVRSLEAECAAMLIRLANPRLWLA